MRTTPSEVISSTRPGIARHIEDLFTPLVPTLSIGDCDVAHSGKPRCRGQRGWLVELRLGGFRLVLRNPSLHYLLDQPGWQGLVRRELDRTLRGLVALEFLGEFLHQTAAHRKKAAM